MKQIYIIISIILLSFVYTQDCTSTADCQDGFACIPPTGDCGFETGPSECTQPGDVCDDSVNPVCGCDGETYSNQCEAIVASVGIDYSTSCGQLDNSNLILNANDPYYYDDIWSVGVILNGDFLASTIQTEINLNDSPIILESITPGIIYNVSPFINYEVSEDNGNINIESMLPIGIPIEEELTIFTLNFTIAEESLGDSLHLSLVTSTMDGLEIENGQSLHRRITSPLRAELQDIEEAFVGDQFFGIEIWITSDIPLQELYIDANVYIGYENYVNEGFNVHWWDTATTDYDGFGSLTDSTFMVTADFYNWWLGVPDSSSFKFGTFSTSLSANAAGQTFDFNGIGGLTLNLDTPGNLIDQLPHSVSVSSSENATCYSSSNCADGYACIPPIGVCYFTPGTSECVEQGGGCYDDWQPVCGCDEVTYTNECFANTEIGVGIAYEGECEEDYTGTTWHIATDGSDATGDGSADNPFASIQQGVNISENGDTVLVSEGTYFENIIWPETNGINLAGSGQDNCIIDGNQNGSVIRFEESLNCIIDSTTQISGFTIQNGFLENSSGGGLYLYESSPVIKEVNISNNVAYSGGGVDCEAYSSPYFSNVIFNSNVAQVAGGAIFSDHYSYSQFSNVIMSNNLASSGGAIYCFYDAHLELNNVLIYGNTATWGGGIYIWASSNLTINNSSIVNNTAEFGGAMYNRYNSTPVFSNSILWNNSQYEIMGEASEASFVEIAYSDIQGGEAGIFDVYITLLDGNIDSDPLFTDPENGDFTLQANSPCIDAGDPNSPLDPDGTIADMGAFYYHQTEFDCYEGDFNNDGQFNVLDIVSLITQIHSFEEPTFQELTCGDINEDGEINIDDYPCYVFIPINENENNDQSRDMVVITVVDTIAILDSNSFTIPIDINVSTSPSGDYVQSFGFDVVISELSSIDSIFIEDGFPHQEGFMVTHSFQDNRIRITGINLNYAGLPEYDGRFFDITVYSSEPIQSTAVLVEEIYVNGGCSYGSNTSIGNDGFITVINCEAGDLDGDGNWNIADIVIMTGLILETTGPPTAEEICNGDNDGDGLLSVNDLEIYHLMCGQLPLPDPYSEIVGFIFGEEASPFMIDDSLFSIPIYKVEEPSIDGFQFDVVIDDYENFELLEIIPNPMIAELGWTFQSTVIDSVVRIIGFNFSALAYEFNNGPLVTLKLSNPGVVMSTGISIQNVFSHGECMVPFEALGMTAEITIEDYLPDATLTFDCPDEVIVGIEGNILPIDIEASEDVWGIQFDIPFDPEIIEFTNVTAGEVINEGEMLNWTVNEDTLFIISFDFDSTPTMFAGAGNIFNLHYNVLGDVDEEIHFEFTDVTMAGYNGQQMEIDVSDECIIPIVQFFDVILSFDCPEEVVIGSDGNEFTIMMESSVEISGVQLEIGANITDFEITYVSNGDISNGFTTALSNGFILSFSGTGLLMQTGYGSLYSVGFIAPENVDELILSFSNVQMAHSSGNPIENIDFSDTCTIPIVEPNEFANECVELSGLAWPECLSETGYGIYNGSCGIVYCGTVDGYGNDWSNWIYDTMEECEEACPQQMVHFSIENQFAFTGDSIEVDIIMDNDSGSGGGIQMEILFDDEILGLNNVIAGAQYPPDWILSVNGNTILGFSLNTTYLLMGGNQQLFQMQISALNDGMSIICMDEIMVSDPNGQPHPTSAYCGVVIVEDMPLQHFTNILNGFEYQYINYDDETGNGTTPIIFIEESDGVDIGDEIGLFDIGGVIGDECPPEYGEVLVGASVYNGGAMEITTYGVIQNCEDDLLLPGFISGNEFIIKIWKAEENLEYPAYYNGQTGQLTWTPNNMNIPMLTPAPLISYDVNMDGELNILDIILTVSIILGEDNALDITWGQEHTADTNSDGLVNVIDILVMVNTILVGD